MDKMILQIDMLVTDLPKFAEMANACSVSPEAIQVHFKPYGEHRVLRIEIPDEQTAHLKTMLALKNSDWSHKSIEESQRDPLMRL